MTSNRSSSPSKVLTSDSNTGSIVLTEVSSNSYIPQILKATKSSSRATDSLKAARTSFSLQSLIFEKRVKRRSDRFLLSSTLEIASKSRDYCRKTNSRTSRASSTLFYSYIVNKWSTISERSRDIREKLFFCSAISATSVVFEFAWAKRSVTPFRENFFGLSI